MSRQYMEVTLRPRISMRRARLVPSLCVAACAALGLAFGPASASEPKPPPEDEPSPFAKDQKNLTGDWSGARNDLRDAGVDFQVGYVNETASNVRGGGSRHTLASDQVALGLALDLERLLNLNPSRLQLTVTERSGQNLSSPDKLHTLQQVQEVYGRGQTWRLTELWYRTWFLDSALDWKIGRMAIGEDFATAKCDFMNLTFCGATPGNLTGDNWYNWPVSGWGTRLKYGLPGATYVQGGVYEVNPNYMLGHYGLQLPDPPGATGALLPLELGWKPRLGDGDLKGAYQVGGWYDTSTAPDLVVNTQGLPLVLDGGDPMQRHGRYGTYLNFSQELLHPSGDKKRTLRAFFSATKADSRTATTDNQVVAGLVFTGPTASRAEDELAFAVGRTHVNDRIAAAQRLQNAAGLGPVDVQSSEYVGELYYSWHLIAGVVLSPDLQYIVQPGAIHQPNDVVLGLKAVLKF